MLNRIINCLNDGKIKVNYLIIKENWIFQKIISLNKSIFWRLKIILTNIKSFRYYWLSNQNKIIKKKTSLKIYLLIEKII